MVNTVTERIRLGWNRRLESFRLRVSRTDSIPELCLLGVLSGVLETGVRSQFSLIWRSRSPGSRPSHGKVCHPCHAAPVAASFALSCP